MGGDVWQLGLQLCIIAVLLTDGGRGGGKRRSAIGPMWEERHMNAFFFRSQTLKYPTLDLASALSQVPGSRDLSTYWTSCTAEKNIATGQGPCLKILMLVSCSAVCYKRGRTQWGSVDEALVKEAQQETHLMYQARPFQVAHECSSGLLPPQSSLAAWAA